MILRPITSIGLCRNIQHKLFQTFRASFASEITHASPHQNDSSNNDEKTKKNSRKPVYTAAIALSSLGLVSYYLYNRRGKTFCQNRYRHDLPTYTMKEVAQHRDLNNTGIWVTYKGGVYDLTKYVAVHPAGEDLIFKAAGKSLEPIWIEYGFHQKPEIIEMLETMRIGNLEGEDVKRNWRKQLRCKFMKNVPHIDPKTYKLELTRDGDKIVKSLSLEDLKRFPKHSIMSSIPCKSNNKQTSGHTWSGARLSDILKELNIKKEDYDQLQFECMDANKSGIPYGSTIPIEKATDPSVEILLAYEMDGAELTPKHGYPVRVVMLELAGAKNVKWLSKIALLKKGEGKDAADSASKQG